jgi:hypothetical protein
VFAFAAAVSAVPDPKTSDVGMTGAHGYYVAKLSMTIEVAVETGSQTEFDNASNASGLGQRWLIVDACRSLN